MINIMRLIILFLLFGCSHGKLYNINYQVNHSFKYIPDKINYMKAPAEFIKDGGGDCEDFANYKRFLAEAQGFTDIKYVFIYGINGKLGHMVIQVNNQILDNNTDGLLPAKIVKGLRINYNNALTWASF